LATIGIQWQPPKRSVGAGFHYIPKWTEVAVTGAMVAAGFAIFGLAAKFLPIFEDEHKPQAPALEPVLDREAVMSNAD
jgi:Ni/Fe-hydrogenase subunit HybB-like protein